jgi:acyl-CoA synthetase (AMP-forming)/AMP-acid ligase II/acyl carrier protein
MVAERITVTFVPTPLAERMLGLGWPRQTALRLMLTGGDTLHRHPGSRLPFALINNYGPTECTVVATSGRVPNDRGTARLPAIGRPISNARVHILDEAMRPVPPGTSGEIYIGGAGVGRGYLNLPELTAARFVPDPFSDAPGGRLYRTGDVGRWLPDGDVAFEGRLDEQVKVRGVRIEPGEIVAALSAHPTVKTSTVVARHDASGETRLVAYVVPAACAPPPSLDALRTALAAVLPEAMIPSAFVLVPDLPLTPNGKVDRAALPAPDDGNTLRAGDYVAPRTVVEERLTAILQDLLGLERVSVTENFFLLGGHSLLGAQVLARVRHELGVEPSLRTLFTSATVAELAAEIEREILVKLDAARATE